MKAKIRSAVACTRIARWTRVCWVDRVVTNDTGSSPASRSTRRSKDGRSAVPRASRV